MMIDRDNKITETEYDMITSVDKQKLSINLKCLLGRGLLCYGFFFFILFQSRFHSYSVKPCKNQQYVTIRRKNIGEKK